MAFRRRRKRPSYIWTSNYTAGTMEVSSTTSFRVGRTTEAGGTTDEIFSVGRKAVCRRVVGQFFFKQVAAVTTAELGFINARLWKRTESQTQVDIKNSFSALDALEGHGKLMWQRFWRMQFVTSVDYASAWPFIAWDGSISLRDQSHWPTSYIDWKGAQPVYENEELILTFQVSAATGAEDFMQVQPFLRALWVPRG